jgi:hypothetical protein
MSLNAPEAKMSEDLKIGLLLFVLATGFATSFFGGYTADYFGAKLGVTQSKCK